VKAVDSLCVAGADSVLMKIFLELFQQYSRHYIELLKSILDNASQNLIEQISLALLHGPYNDINDDTLFVLQLLVTRCTSLTVMVETISSLLDKIKNDLSLNLRFNSIYRQFLNNKPN
jgi:hypothetical protein